MNKEKELQGSFIIEDYNTKAKFRNKKFLEYVGRLKYLIIFSVSLMALSTIFELLGPYILGLILDGELTEGIGARDISHYYKLVGIFFAVSISNAIFAYYGARISAKVANKLAQIIRKDTFEHVLSLPVQFFDKYPIGKIVNRITNDTNDVRSLFSLLFNQILTTVLRAIILIIGLFTINAKITIYVLMVTPIAYIIFKDFFNKTTRYQKELKSSRSELNGNLAENIQSMEIVQAFNKEDEIYEEFSEINDKINKEGWNLATLWSYSGYNASNTLGLIINMTLIISFGVATLRGNPFMTTGSLFVFIQYISRLTGSLNMLMDQMGNLEGTKSAADQLFELIRVEPYKEGSETIENMEGNIKFDNVTFAYNENEKVIHDLSFKIDKGTSAAFVGHTGSGKSTVMNLIYKFYHINEGHIYIDGHDIEKLNMEEVRKDMAIVFQNPYLFEGTVYENIALFDNNISKNEAELALISVGGDKILQREGGIDSVVRESGAGFSAGEKQIISFARAMVRDPKILVLDEATANVDSETEALIQFGLNRLKRGRTTLIIAHRLSTIKDVDNIYLLDKGRLIEQGSHEELVELGGVYADMYKNN